MESERVWRCKGLADGCETLEEMAQALEEAAEELRRMASEGETLREAVEDDYAYIELGDGPVEDAYNPLADDREG